MSGFAKEFGGESLYRWNLYYGCYMEKRTQGRYPGPNLTGLQILTSSH